MVVRHTEAKTKKGLLAEIPRDETDHERLLEMTDIRSGAYEKLGLNGMTCNGDLYQRSRFPQSEGQIFEFSSLVERNQMEEMPHGY